MAKYIKKTDNPNMGRKKIPLIMNLPEKCIVYEQILLWIDMQATQEEVAGLFHVSVETLNGRLLDHFGLTFSELRKRVDGHGKLSVRRFQFKLAEKNATMAIWLGKQWLGQRDHPEDLKNLVLEEVRRGLKELSEQSGGKISKQLEVAP